MKPGPRCFDVAFAAEPSRRFSTFSAASKHARLLTPSPLVGDRIDLWFSTLSTRHAWLKRSIWFSLKSIKWLTGRQITPTLSLAIQKVA